VNPAQAIRDVQALRLLEAYMAQCQDYDGRFVRTRDEWVATFREFGWHRYGMAHPLPREEALPEVVRLYRGSPEEFITNLSWTADAASAKRYAALSEGGRVWVADVPRDAVLGTLHGAYGFVPQEYLVDALALRIKPL
jgi:hypothetical protein